MSDFQTQIEDLVGSVSDTTALSNWLTDSAKKMIDIIPPDKLEIISDEITGTNADKITTIDVGSNYRISSVYSNYGTRIYKARKIPFHLNGLAQDSGSIHYATYEDPVYWMDNKYLKISPTSDGIARGVAYPTVAYNDSTITNFPQQLEPAVIYDIAIKSLLREYYEAVNSINSLTFSTQNVPIAPSTPSFSYTDATLGTYTATTVGSLGTAPTYTKPVTGASISNAETYIQTDEDIEKGQGELSKVKTQLEKFQMDLYNELNKFNKENAEYQATVQKAIEDARLAQQKILQEASETLNKNLQNEAQELARQMKEYESKLIKYQNDIGVYNAKMNEEVQRYGSTIQQKSSEIQAIPNQITLLTKERDEIIANYIGS